MRLALADVARATGGYLIGSDSEAAPGGEPVAGVAIDSRMVQPGQLFVPLVAGRDGHAFVPAAVAAGAGAYLTSRSEDPPVPGVPAVVVADTTAALADLGRLARRRLGERVVAVTGSVGKTSVKDLLATVLARRWVTAAAVRSFNNELGVPLTLLNAPDDATASVVEMGARGVGHIAHLCSIARPTVGVVTVVGGAHLELFGSIEAVARAKGELVEALPPGGWAVLNAEDERVAAMAARTRAAVLRYGGAGEVRAEAVHLDDELRPRFALVSPWGGGEVRLGVRGAHMVTNALAAAAAGFVLGLAPEEVIDGLAAAELSPWRMELRRTASGAVVLNDAYNANPLSMRAALRALAALPAAPGGRRVAVLGLMAELGPGGPAEHRAIGDFADRLGIEVLAVGTADYGSAPLPDGAAAAERLGRLGPGDAVLVKASRVAGLEVLAAQLAMGPAADDA